MPDAEKTKPEDTPQGPVVAEEVRPLDASREGTVLHTLADLRQTRRFEPPGGPEAPEEGEEEQPPAEEPEAEEEAAGGGESPAGPEGPPVSDTGPKFKYKSQEEAERAYREAERRMHQATSEKAALQRELEELKQRLAALEGKQQGEQPERTPPPKEEAVERLVALNNQIDNLDPFDPDYQRRRAELELEKAFILDAVKGREAIPSPEAVKELVRRELAAREEEETRRRELEDLSRRVTRMAESYGLDMKPDSWDYRQFWRAVRAGDVPEGDLETQVKTLAEEILADKANFGQRAVQSMKKIHDENAVLGRGGAGPPAGGQEMKRPTSIHEILAANRRRI